MRRPPILDAHRSASFRKVWAASLRVAAPRLDAVAYSVVLGVWLRQWLRADLDEPDDPRLAAELVHIVDEDGDRPPGRDQGMPALTTRFPRMELRIGVVRTAKELSLELDGSADDVVAKVDAALGRQLARRVVHRRQGTACRDTGRQDRVRGDRRGRLLEAGRLRALRPATPMGSPPGLLDRRLLFFTGKGGVGKSTVTAATALLAAERGKRVLLVEVDGKGNLTALFEHPPVGFEPREVHPGVRRCR